MQIVETTITNAHIKMKLADPAAPEAGRLSFRVPIPRAGPYDDSARQVQLAALRSAQDLIVEEIRRLSGR